MVSRWENRAYGTQTVVADAVAKPIALVRASAVKSAIVASIGGVRLSRLAWPGMSWPKHDDDDDDERLLPSAQNPAQRIPHPSPVQAALLVPHLGWHGNLESAADSSPYSGVCWFACLIILLRMVRAPTWGFFVVGAGIVQTFDIMFKSLALTDSSASFAGANFRLLHRWQWLAPRR
ncbi:hypothetical protein S40288_10825 [Stachybotrys chartarum IBT 40288]|nr:hypothetical protein S40288_10825 [Stachybotrys chartarum IBT 40288]